MKRNVENTSKILASRNHYIIILEKIHCVLLNGNNKAHALVISKLILLLKQDNISHFIKMVNGIDMWGGAGAVWEVYFENKKLSREFEENMIFLINLMEETKIIGTGIKPIRKIFYDNINKYADG